MAEYDSPHFDPPAPVTIVTLRNQSTRAVSSEVVLLVDTGADATLLPRSAIKQIGLQPLADLNYQLMGFDGKTSSAQVADLDMIFFESHLPRSILAH